MQDKLGHNELNYDKKNHGNLIKRQKYGMNSYLSVRRILCKFMLLNLNLIL